MLRATYTGLRSQHLDSPPCADLFQTLVFRSALRVCNSGFEVYHPRCVGSVTKNFLCITHTVEHNYISPGSTLGIQLHVLALYVGRLQVVI